MGERAGNGKLEDRSYNLLQNPIHRETMPDLVLAWATLDGALAMLLAHVMGACYHEAADSLGKQSGSGKLGEMIPLIKQ